MSSVARGPCAGLTARGRPHVAVCPLGGGDGVTTVACLRKWLGRAAQRINRWEADAVAPSTALPPDPPAPEVTVLTTVARGGLLWVGMAAVLAARLGVGPGVPPATASSR